MGLSRGAVSVTGTGGTPCHYEVVRVEARSIWSGLLSLLGADASPAIIPERLPAAADGVLGGAGLA